MLTPKMDGVPALQVVRLERWYGDALRLQRVQCFRQPGEVVSVGQYRDIRVPAKLCCAVEHARLAAHQQVLDAARSQGQKDFENRVRDQASLRSPKRNPKAFGFPTSAVGVSCDTTVPIRLRKATRLGIPCSCHQFVAFSSQTQGRSRYCDVVHRSGIKAQPTVAVRCSASSSRSRARGRVPASSIRGWLRARRRRSRGRARRSDGRGASAPPLLEP